jgi:hypothetical protein
MTLSQENQDHNHTLEGAVLDNQQLVLDHNLYPGTPSHIHTLQGIVPG